MIRRLLVFVIIPMALFIMAMVNRPLFYKVQTYYDPDYCYLMNGLTLASLKMQIGHIDHPGTTVQLLSAVIIRLTYLTRITNDDIVTDVLTYPEYYLESISFTFTMLLFFILLIFGYLIYNSSGSYTAGLLFQLIPVYSYTIFRFSFFRCNPNILLLMLVLVYIGVIVIYCLNERGCRPERKSDSISDSSNIFRKNKLLIVFSLLCGCFLSTKINSLPLILFPFLFFRRFTEKTTFIAMTIAFFIVFTFPIINQYPRLFHWVGNVILHSDVHGTGSPNFIDPGVFYRNFLTIIKTEPVLIGVVCISIIYTVKYYKDILYVQTVKILFLITLVQIVGIIMVSKHYAPAYMITIIPTIFINLYIIIFLLQKSNIAKEYVALAFIAITLTITGISRFNRPQRKKVEINLSENNIFSFGTPSKTYALSWGNDYCNNLYAKRLEQLYGQQYFYNLWSGTFKTWTHETTLENLLQINNRWILYGNENLLSKTTLKLKKISNKKFLIDNSK